MGKVKIKRKSTLIDMTAMSDVTVLLLTFFMLTSTFLQKEPTIVYTPSSVSEEKVPVKNLVTVLVSPADKSGRLENPATTEGKIYLSFAGDDNLFSDTLRYDILDEAVNIYNQQIQARGSKDIIKLNQAQKDAFAKTNMMGTPFKYLPEVLSMDIVQRDKLMGDLTNPQTVEKVGIPIRPVKDWGVKWKDNHNLNDFDIWMKALKNVANNAKNDYLIKENIPNDKEHKDEIASKEILYNAIAKGQGITIKADKDTPFSVLNVIFENLRYMELNKFSMMTALKAKDN